MKIRKKHLLIVLGIILIAVLSFTFIYLNSYSKSLVTLEDYQKSDPNILIKEEDNGILIDGLGSNTTMIVFYPGAKIEPSAYLPLLFKLEQNGIDCFIVKMPFNLAIFDQDAFNEVYDQFQEQNWYIMGHSLGGAMAANFAVDESNKLSGIILLAAYPTKELKATNLPLLSIYGDQDGVLNLEKYNENKNNWPDNSYETIIKGGNHANFGSYGDQKGDNKALISPEEQQTKTVETIINFINQTK